MKIFLDTANVELIKKWFETGIIDGVTTNPSLLSKEGPNTTKTLKEICTIVSGDVSIEVVEKETQKVYEQALQISKIAKNVVVKIPFDKQYLPVIKKLAKENVKINVTLIFSALQALLVAKLNVAYISPFIGRLDDIGQNGLEILEQLVQLKYNYNFKSEILAASIRGVNHFTNSALIGSDIATVPPAVLDKIMIHPLTERGIIKFDSDWKKLGKKSLL